MPSIPEHLRNTLSVQNHAGNDLGDNYLYQIMWLEHGLIKMDVIRLNLAVVIGDTKSSNLY